MLDGTMVHAKAEKKEFSMVVLMVYSLVPLTVDWTVCAMEHLLAGW